MENFHVPAHEIDSRIARLKQGMRSRHMDGLFIAQRMDLFYFSGTCQNGFLYVPARGRPQLFIRRSLARAVAESSLAQVAPVSSVREIPERIASCHGSPPGVIGFELDVLPVREFRFYRQLLSARHTMDASDLILSVRSRKSAWEIAQIEHTAEVSRKVFEYIRETLAPGVMEIEFAGMYETYARRLGHSGQLRIRDYRTEGYNWHVASGTHGACLGLLDSPVSGRGTSAAFPSGASRKKLAAGEPILIDVGTVVNGYHMDETRMFAIESMPPAALDACRACIEIHDTLIAAAKPGMFCSELFDLGVKTAHKLGYADIYLGPDGHKVSFVGHGIGVELIEPPFLAAGRKEHLESGMVFALEPKMLFTDRFAVGVESVFLVTDHGGQLLSRVPVDIFIC